MSAGAPTPRADFALHCYQVATQAMIALGLAPNPVSNETSVDLGMAKHLIDTLDMLKTKSEGNRTEEETQVLMSFLFDLRMRYVEQSKASSPSGEADAPAPSE